MRETGLRNAILGLKALPRVQNIAAGELPVRMCE